MASLETTELKLKSTPTGGNEAHQSPYYRRLVSAGYKGFLQGTLGGASLYGLFGLAIGGLVAIPFLPVVGASAFLLAPAFAGLGIFKGADTFGQIGSMAAITAESSDLAEQRRYLLDRYYDLPDGPEGDKEAETIKKELLSRATDHGQPPHFFHWKTVLVGALIGATLVMGALMVTGGLGSGSAAIGVATKVVEYLGIKTALLEAGALAKITAVALGLGGATAGALAGATIGIDRYYIRKWFDHTQDIVHPSSRLDYGLMERHRQVESLKEAAKADAKTKQQMAAIAGLDAAAPAVQDSGPKAPAPKPIAALDKAVDEKPTHTISAARRDGLAAIHRAMELPVV